MTWQDKLKERNMVDTLARPKMPVALETLQREEDFAPLRRLADDLEKSPIQVIAEAILDLRYGALKEIGEALEKIVAHDRQEGNNAINFADLLHVWAMSHH